MPPSICLLTQESLQNAFYSRFFLLKCSRKEKGVVLDNSHSKYITTDECSYVGGDTSSNSWRLLSLRSVKPESETRTQADYGKGMTT